MPIISKIEAKTTRGRLLYALIFTLLSIGGLTMIYPFVIMMSGSLRSEMDETDLDLVPQYLFNRDVLYLKFLETKFNQDIGARNAVHLRQNFSFRMIEPPESVNDQQVEDFREFLAAEGRQRHWGVLGGIAGVRTVPENLRELRNRVAAKFDDDLDAFNRQVGAVLPSWQAVILAPPLWVSQRYEFPDNVLYHTYFEMADEAPAAEWVPISLTGNFLETMIFPLYGQVSTAAFNEANPGLTLESYRDFALPERAPPAELGNLRALWIEYVREELNPSFIILEETSAEAFRDYLREVHGTIDDLNLAWGSELTDFGQIDLPRGEWLRGTLRRDYLDFLQGKDPAYYRLTGPEFSWRAWLERRHGGIDAVNAAHGTAFPDLARVHMPVEELDMTHVAENSGSLRWQYATRNYVNVIDELFLRGRAFVNTVIFCTLSVSLALLVNPLTAYALSRFQLPGAYKILLLLMATMAFPPMVTLIPKFIILQQLNLMNTFTALVLPTVANGYLIFLLKGFFDSLPRELYQAAMIDGASEFRIFFQITMALSKPILAVVALMAFNASYTMFLYPLLVAPREDMWLLSVWLYQYQLSASMAGVFASVLIASIPTLLVFIFAQNIIMRGIVVPTEK